MGYVEELLERAKKMEEKHQDPGFKPTLSDVFEKIGILQELGFVDDLIRAEMTTKDREDA